MAHAQGRKTFLFKITIVIVSCVAVVIVSQFPSAVPETSGQTTEIENRRVPSVRPINSLIDDFDKSIQLRFLTAPNFGMRRMEPPGPTNPHFEQFSPNTDAEKASVAGFEANNWDVGIYLFGKRTQPRANAKTEKFEIKYRLFDPLPVTRDLKRSDLLRSKTLLTEVKKAFLHFQQPDSPNHEGVTFDIGEWSYIARPVRAVQQSCLQCHKDYVVTKKLGDGKFKFRKRQVGDANGVLVYAFSKRDK